MQLISSSKFCVNYPSAVQYLNHRHMKQNGRLHCFPKPYNSKEVFFLFVCFFVLVQWGIRSHRKRAKGTYSSPKKDISRWALMMSKHTVLDTYNKPIPYSFCRRSQYIFLLLHENEEKSPTKITKTFQP